MEQRPQTPSPRPGSSCPFPAGKSGAITQQPLQAGTEVSFPRGQIPAVFFPYLGRLQHLGVGPLPVLKAGKTHLAEMPGELASANSCRAKIPGPFSASTKQFSLLFAMGTTQASMTFPD